MAADFKVKFFFADATTIEETFPPQVTVAEAKSKLIAAWPEGEAEQLAGTLSARVSLAQIFV